MDLSLGLFKHLDQVSRQREKIKLEPYLSILESRRAFNLDKKSFVEKFAIQFFDIYFPGEGKELLNSERAKHLVGFSDEDDTYDRAKATIDWISNLIKVGWHLCSNI